MDSLDLLLSGARVAARKLSVATTEEKNAALLKMADGLEAATDEILQANAIDMQNAQGVLSEVMQDRLRLTPQRICAMANAIRETASLPADMVLEEKLRRFTTMMAFVR